MGLKHVKIEMGVDGGESYEAELLPVETEERTEFVVVENTEEGPNFRIEETKPRGRDG